MNEQDLGRFTTAFLQFSELYPTVRDSDARAVAYWAALRWYSFDALTAALTKAITEHKEYFPTAGQLTELCNRESTRLERERANAHRMLPPPADRARELVLQDFYHACDKARTFDGTEMSEVEKETIGGLVRILTRYYNPQATSERCDDNARLLVSGFMQRKFTASACVKGLRRAPAIFAVAPTIGGFESLIRGETPTSGLPAGWLVADAVKAETPHPNAPPEPRDHRDWQMDAAGEKGEREAA